MAAVTQVRILVTATSSLYCIQCILKFFLTNNAEAAMLWCSGQFIFGCYDRLVFRTLRCARSILGWSPGHGNFRRLVALAVVMLIFFLIVNVVAEIV